MGIHLGGARSWGVPVAGGFVSLDTADAQAILTAASGLAKTLVRAGGAAAALGVVAAFLLLRSREDNIPIGSLAHIYSPGRRFNGVLLSEDLLFEVNRERLSVPFRMVNRIYNPDRGFFSLGNIVQLVDGSRYYSVKFLTPVIDCLGVAGQQSIDLRTPNTELRGHTVCEIGELRKSLVFALAHSREQIVREFGESVFTQFFTHRAT